MLVLGVSGPGRLYSLDHFPLSFNFAFLWVGLILESQVENMGTSSSRLMISLQLVLFILPENVAGKTLIGLHSSGIMASQRYPCPNF